MWVVQPTRHRRPVTLHHLGRKFPGLLALALMACNSRYVFDATVAAHCGTDSDCPTDMYCEDESSQCVGCTLDEQCATSERKRCDYALNRCVECGSNSDCATGQICEHVTHRCVTACTEDTESVCGSRTEAAPEESELCEVSRGICMFCDQWRPCAGSEGGLLCDSTIGLCVQCLTDTDCSGATPRCDRTRGACVECMNGDDCPSLTPWCQPQSSRCISVIIPR